MRNPLIRSQPVIVYYTNDGKGHKTELDALLHHKGLVQKLKSFRSQLKIMVEEQKERKKTRLSIVNRTHRYLEPTQFGRDVEEIRQDMLALSQQQLFRRASHIRMKEWEIEDLREALREPDKKRR